MVASHFNLSGLPNGWMGRSAFAWLLIGVVLYANALNGAFCKYIEKLPLDYISIPYKNIWMSSPDLQVEMFARLRVVLGAASIYVNLLILYVFLGILRFHINQEQVLGGRFTVLLIFSVVTLLAFCWYYFKPPTLVPPEGPRAK